MSIYSTVVIVLAALLFIFSAAHLGLSGYMMNYWITRNNKFFNWTTAINTSYPVYWLPNNNLTRSYVLQLVTAIMGVVIGATVFGILVTNRPLTFVGTGKRAPRTVTWPLTTIILSLLVFALALATLVVSFYDNTHHGARAITSVGLCVASHRPLSDNLCSPNVGYYAWYTMEGWACRIGPIYRSSVRPPSDNATAVLSQTCRIAYLSRWWTVAIILLPIFILIGALFEMRRRNIVRFNERQEMGAGLYPKEQSFSSAATESPMSPVSPITPGGTLPRYSAAPELGGNGRSTHETGGKQVMEAPEKAPYDEMPADKHQVYSELSANKSKDVVVDEPNTA